METLKRMVYLYTEESPHYKFQCIYDDFHHALQKAEAFVGAHNEVDGLSTKPKKGTSGEEHWVRRSTSFGERVGRVLSIPYFSAP